MGGKAGMDPLRNFRTGFPPAEPEFYLSPGL